MATFDIIVRLLLSISTILIFPGIILGIVFAVISLKEIDQIKKAKYKKIMWWSFFGPMGIMLVLITVWGFISVASNFK
jgi:uncharacterized membrane protein YdcZ (DUF606 family)